MSVETLAKAFLQSLGLVGIAALLFDGLFRHIRHEARRDVAVGLLFAGATTASMSIPAELAPGIIFDMRHPLLVLAPVFGGLPAAVLTALAAAGLRWEIGGAGLTAGIVGIATSASVGYLMARLTARHTLDLRLLSAFAAATLTSFLSLLALPVATALAVLNQVGLYLTVGNVVSTMLIGRLFDQIRLRATRERALVSDATTDALTGLTNRRTFDWRAPHLFAEAARTAQPCALLLIDIDHFKTINDTFGHAAGDHVLGNVGRALAADIAGGDLVARFGGEEFAVVLRHCDRTAAEQAADRLRALIESIPHELRGISLRVTVSIGVHVAADGQEAFASVFRRADLALYRAKSLGRNRVELALAA